MKMVILLEEWQYFKTLQITFHQFEGGIGNHENAMRPSK